MYGPSETEVGVLCTWFFGLHQAYYVRRGRVTHQAVSRRVRRTHRDTALVRRVSAVAVSAVRALSLTGRNVHESIGCQFAVSGDSPTVMSELTCDIDEWN